MWKDSVRNRYRWAGIENKMDELIYELSKAEEEEEVGLYLLHLHYDNEIDLNFFSKTEKGKIKKLLGILINDTMQHRERLALVIKELMEKRKTCAG